jgi:ABC-type dipeptide/oligopeptide/nickel transport system permease subunit
MFKKLISDKRALIGLFIIALIVIGVVTVSWWAKYDPYQSDLQNIAQPPSLKHLLGTDELGRDVLTRIFYGGRISLSLGVVSVGIGLIAGIPLGMLAGYFGKGLDLAITGFIDILLAFPPLLLAIAMVSILGPGLYNAMLAIGTSLVPFYARLVRGSVLAIKERDFVEAARAAGGTAFYILRQHILPNCISPLIVQSTFNMASAILSAASLGFLGLGAQPPLPEWGTMISRGRVYIRVAPHITTFPGLAIFVVVLAFNLLGDSLRDVLDPYMRKRQKIFI